VVGRRQSGAYHAAEAAAAKSELPLRELPQSVRVVTRQAIDDLRRSGERVTVVLDAAAVNSAPDARIAADFADLAVLVAGYGRDTASAVSDASAVFDPSRLAGVVFNKVP
jgi:hypothetical protein